jgi:hypothetical protein
MSTINTISEFLLHAGTDFRVFDMARGIRPLETQLFLDIETAQQPAPFPRQQHAWFGVLFFNKSASTTHYIWFVKFPLDEQGLVIAAARQQFLQIVVEALGQTLDKNTNDNNQLPDNPFTFVPNQQQLADFNSICRQNLDLPASQHFAKAHRYIVEPTKYDWRDVSLQGLADFTCVLNKEPYKRLLLTQFSVIAPEMRHAICTSLENHVLDHDLTNLLVDWYEQHSNDEQILSATLRGLCQSVQQLTVKTLLYSILGTKNGQNSAVLMLIAARHWRYLTDNEMLVRYMQALANCDTDSFIGLYSDLVQIPQTRATMLSVLRWPIKSPELTTAIGHLFGHNVK